MPLLLRAEASAQAHLRIAQVCFFAPMRERISAILLLTQVLFIKRGKFRGKMKYKKASDFSEALISLELMVGFEPMTCSLRMSCSTN